MKSVMGDSANDRYCRASRAVVQAPPVKTSPELALDLALALALALALDLDLDLDLRDFRRP
ncbi:MAG: hypothetical protein ACWA7D_19445, partial [Pseudomonas asiatica]